MWKREIPFWLSLIQVKGPQRDTNHLSSWLSLPGKSSDDPIVPQRLEQHGVLHVAEDPADVVGVRGTGEVGVQSLPRLPAVVGDGLLLVQLADELHSVFGVMFPAC